jgi:hypothetical protein
MLEFFHKNQGKSMAFKNSMALRFARKKQVIVITGFLFFYASKIGVLVDIERKTTEHGLGFAFPWAKVRMARLLLENTQVNIDTGFDDYISQKQTEQSSLGEQIGDAFDIDVGFGI